ncbi:hypothetical protein QJS10_CPA01g01639 [Acorus calamus]|uniref:RNase H type-1 domain-containing protein n=1 Tax=Acorus calamus TaxID=4465 RepID=A0AAV9FWQ8_ACOCL|nr:hypothetical protein QJS10_CPA01g01639 [Acorus calamus]
MEDPAPPDPLQGSPSPSPDPKLKDPLPPQAGTIDIILKSLSLSRSGSSRVRNPSDEHEGNGDLPASKGKDVVVDNTPIDSNPNVNGTAYNSAKPPYGSSSTLSKTTAKAPSKGQMEKGRRPPPAKQGRRPGAPPLAQSSRAWADLFPSQPRHQPNTLLVPIELGSHEGRKFVDCDEEDLKEMDSHWGLSLVGYVIGKRPYYKPFLDFLYRIWNPKGSLEVLMREGGFFITKFSNEEDLMNVMEGGPWLMAGHPIVLRRWSRGMRMEMERLETIPIWIRFPALPLHMWGTRLISKLASAIGKPLYMDTATANRSRIAFARVCIEISAHSDLPDSILYREEGIWKDILVEYEWKPSPCPACSTFGHSSAQCAVTPTQVHVASKEGRHPTTQVYVPILKPPNLEAPKQPINSEVEANATVAAELTPATKQDPTSEGILQNSTPTRPNAKEYSSNRFSILSSEEEVLPEAEPVGVEGIHGVLFESSQKPTPSISLEERKTQPSGYVEAKDPITQGPGLATNSINVGKEDIIQEDISEMSSSLEVSFQSLQTEVVSKGSSIRVPPHEEGVRENTINAASKGGLPTGATKHPKKDKSQRNISLPLTEISILTTAKFSQFIKTELVDSSARTSPTLSPLKVGLVFYGIQAVLLFRKLLATKAALKRWNNCVFGPVFHHLQEKKLTLSQAQLALLNDPLNPCKVADEKAAKIDYTEALQQEECFLRQKSRQNWLALGDRNSKFFYSSIQSRNSRNSISSLRNKEGVLTYDHAEIKSLIGEYYFNLLNRESNEGSLQSAKALDKLFQDFASQSGLHLNAGKSQIFANQSLPLFCNTLSIQQQSLPVKYLGLPLFTGSLTRSLCQPLIDKVRLRIQSWTGKLLSLAGRLELILSVLSSFHIFWSTAFSIPRAATKEIERIIRNFLWQGSSMEKKTHHVSWNLICRPKSEGGLGISRIDDWIRGSSGARFWELASNIPSMWASWIKKRYLRKENIWNCRPPNGSSCSWKQIIKARDWVTSNTKFIIFEGHTIKLWLDPWLNGRSLLQAAGRMILTWGPANSTPLSALIKDGKWCKPSRWPPDMDLLWSEIIDIEDMLIKGPAPKRLSDLSSWLDTKVTHPVKKTIAASMLTTFFWFIWMERNNRIFRGKSLHKRELMRRIKAEISIRLQFSVLKAAISPELIKVAENYGTSISDIPVTSKPVQWIPPDSNWLKVNSDGSLSEDRGGYGAIIRDEKGNFIIGAAGQSNPKSINLLEFQGILLGLELGLQIGASRIWFEADSTTAIAWLKGTGSLPWTALRIQRKLQMGLALLQSWKISHVHREGNSVADLLASHRTSNGTSIYQIHDLWPTIEELLRKDKSGTIYMRSS